MNPNEQLIEEFYAAFAQGHAKTMASCYHKEAVFKDPVFGELNAEQAVAMWEMLIERSKGELEIVFSDVTADANMGSAKWAATYRFSKTQRIVVNQVNAFFEFRDGLIYRHTDEFDFWKWTRQAFGISGVLLGWSGFMRQKISSEARSALQKYMSRAKS